MEQDKLKPEQRLPDGTSGIHSSPDRWQLLLVLTFDFLQIRLRACSPCNRRVPLDLARLYVIDGRVGTRLLMPILLRF